MPCRSGSRFGGQFIGPFPAVRCRKGPRSAVVFDVIEHGRDGLRRLGILHDEASAHVEDDAHGADVDWTSFDTGLATRASPQFFFGDVVPKEGFAISVAPLPACGLYGFAHLFHTVTGVHHDLTRREFLACLVGWTVGSTAATLGAGVLRLHFLKQHWGGSGEVGTEG